MSTLRPDQSRAVERVLAQPHSLLYGAMGSGKSAVAARAIRGATGQVLLIAPGRVLDHVWPGELLDWCGIGEDQIARLHKASSPARREELLRSPRYKVATLTPDMLPRLAPYLIHGRHGYRRLVIDEVTKFKASGSARVKALRRFYASGRVHWSLTMTGTPVSDAWEHLYAIALCTDGGETFGTRKDRFLDRYFLPPLYKHAKRELRYGAAEKLTLALASVIVQLDDNRHTLQGLRVVKHSHGLTGEVAALYRQLAKHYVATDCDGNVFEAANAAVLQGRLRQLTSGVLYLDDGEGYIDYSDARVVQAVAIAEKIAQAGRRTLVCYEHRADRDRFERLYRGTKRPLVRLSKTKSWLKEWTAAPDGVLLLHPRSGGHGLHLSALCSDVIFITTPWSRDLFDQAIARVWRTGQKNQVTVHHIVVPGTVDDAVEARLRTKADYDRWFKQHLATFEADL